MKRTLHFLSVILILTCVEGQCQETVFGLLKKDVKLADTYYEEKNFLSALDLYKNARRKDPSSKEISIKVARCHYFLKQYAEAVSVYEKYMNNGFLSMKNT
jgi:tetratricopeptide (TPR) repeat protein